MNIMMFSSAAWDDKNSLGNTFSNWFCGSEWKEDKFSHFYLRKQNPCNENRVDYYNLSAMDIIRGFFRGKIKGKLFNSDSIKVYECVTETHHLREQKNIEKLHKSNNQIVYMLHELVWLSGLWNNKYFEEFVEEKAPDIFFAFATDVFVLSSIINYLKKNTNCKIVLFVADDVYGAYSKLIFPRRKYLLGLFRKCIKQADGLYAVSDEMAELYEKQFGRKITTLYKGCELSTPIKENIGSPIKIVYAGNLLWGRDDILHQLALVLEKINTDRVHMQLEIYTGATVTQEISRKLNVGNSSRIVGCRPYKEITSIMQNADVVLYVESFDDKMKEIVRCSLSTKIMDCLQSGSIVLGVGPSDVSSIKYLKRISGTIVVDDITKVSDALMYILDNQDEMLDNMRSVRAYAQRHHEITTVQKRLRDSFIKMIDE